MSVKYVAPEIELHLGRWSGRLATAGLLFAASCLVFLPYGVGGRIPMELRLPLWVGIALGFLFAARLAYRSMQLHRYWPVLYAFFVASAAQLVDWHFSDWLPRLLNVPNETPAWFGLVKLESSLLIVLVITVLILLARADFGSLYLKRGRTWWGLLVGLATFAFFSATALWAAPVLFTGQTVAPESLIPLAPWLLIFVLSNGFAEELLFRGLFLGRFRSLVGAYPAILLITTIFTLWHLDVTYGRSQSILLLVVFALGFAWAWITHKTDSLWGAALFHAGADIPVVLALLSTLT